jgi:hypothetical protein
MTEHCWAHWAIVATSKESTLQCRCQELSIQSSDYWFLHVWESQWEFRSDITTLLIAFSAVSEGSFMYNVLILIHDLSVCHLTSHQSLEHIKQYFLYIDNLVSIKRSTASVLIQNQAENCTSLKSMMLTHHVKTVNVEYQMKEWLKMQWQHWASVR